MMHIHREIRSIVDYLSSADNPSSADRNNRGDA